MKNDSDARTPDDDVLAMRALLRDRPAPQGDASVSAETLHAFLDGELPAPEARAVALALVADPSLAEDLRVTAGLKRAKNESVEAEVPARASRSRLLWASAAALAAAVLALWIMRPPAPSPGGSEEIRAGGETSPIVSSVVGESLPRDAFVLTWSGGPNEVTWDVQVTTEELTVVFQAFDREQPSVRVPASVLRDHAAGTKLLWRVTAVDAAGGRSRSAAFRVRLR